MDLSKSANLFLEVVQGSLKACINLGEKCQIESDCCELLDCIPKYDNEYNYCACVYSYVPGFDSNNMPVCVYSMPYAWRIVLGAVGTLIALTVIGFLLKFRADRKAARESAATAAVAQETTPGVFESAEFNIADFVVPAPAPSAPSNLQEFDQPPSYGFVMGDENNDLSAKNDD
ncbi:uncharacterized protein LOC132204458 [Neocloeon triangulifer]|uniref:uncharacterized protein LOC132204458 n=1 Tax=Neocloeon triangulifer TaxID=2078957 RepID=UPI00286EEEB7|nr:uncharacterized protein LOC132204458 [Neocloeon triangulifer]